MDKERYIRRFETILANALKKTENEFDKILSRSLEKYNHYFSDLFDLVYNQTEQYFV